MTEVTQQDRALTWASLGVPVLICNGNKRPMADLCPRAVYSATTDADTLRSWFRRYRFGLIAIPCGEPSGVVVVDIDCHVGRPNGFRTLAKLGIEPDDISPHFETTPSGGQHRFCRFDGIATSSLPGIDVLSTGRYCLVWGEPLASLEDLPPVPAVLRKSAAPAPTPQVERPLTPVPAWVRREDAGKGISTDWRDLSFSIELLALALRVIPNNDDTTRDDWLKVIMAIHDATGGSEEGLLLAKLWSAKNPVHGTYWQRREAPTKLRRARRSSLFDIWEWLDGRKTDKRPVTYLSIFKLAHEANPLWDIER